MPYSLNDPTALPPMAEPRHVPDSLSPAEASVSDELNQTAAKARFAKIAAGIRPGIQVELRAAESEAEETVFNSAEAEAIRNSANQFRSAWLDFGESARKISRTTDLSASGRDAAMDRAAERRVAAIAKAVETGASRSGDALLAAYPPARPNPLPEALISEAGLVLQTAGFASAAGFLDDLYTALVAARSTASTPEEKHRQDALLARAYSPVATRRATKPESFAQILIGSYAEASDLVRDHLKIVNGGFLHDAAVSFVDAIRTEFTVINQMAIDNNGFDPVMRIAAPTLFPPSA